MAEQLNPLLSKLKLPGKILKLPSSGFFYTNEIDPECKAEVEVRPMSALAEISIKSPELLYTGKALEDVIRECVPQIKKPLDLFSKDIDAILCFLRMVTYGNELEITATHNCENGEEHSYIVDLNKVVGEMTYLDPTTFKDLYTVQLDDQTVTLQPLTMRNVVTMLQDAKTSSETGKMDTDQMKRFLVSNLLLIIREVDGITDRKMIEEWVRILSAKHVQTIYEKYEKANEWGINTTSKFVCLDCQTEFEMELPLNPANFFSG